MILMIPPGFPVSGLINERLQLNNLTSYEELEPDNGYRYFRLS